MDPLGQLYLICTVLGWGFIIACVLLGQIDHGHGGGGEGQIGHDGIGGHIGGHGAANGAHHIAQNIAHGSHGAHGAEMHLDGHGLGHGHGTGHGHTVGNHGHHNGHANNHSNSDDAHTTVNPVVRSRENRLYFILISLLSPMTISIFAGFFGTVGFITWHYAPWLGYKTLVPALGAALIATELIKRAMTAFAMKLSATSLTKRGEAVGRIAMVITPIADGRLGEVSYVIGTTRFNASARAAEPGQDFARGTKVMIVETDGPVVFVEPAKEMDLDLI